MLTKLILRALSILFGVSALTNILVALSSGKPDLIIFTSLFSFAIAYFFWRWSCKYDNLKETPQPKNSASDEINVPIKLTITTEYRTSHSTQDKPDRDNWEGAFWDVPSPRKISGNLHIEYTDGAGSRTSRDIRLMKYGAWEGGAMIWAYCNLRHANRTFRTDRIISCTDLDSGEVIENLEAWLDEQYQSSPDRAIEKVIESSWDVLRVLYYVGKADGRLTQKERAVMREAVRSLSEHPDIDRTRIDGLFDSMEPPSITAFKQAFGRLAKQNRELAVKVAQWSSSMVATEKTISPAEQEALEYFKATLNKSAPQPSMTKTGEITGVL